MVMLRFSTRDYRPADRLEATRDIYAAMVDIELTPADDRHFRLAAMLRLLPGVTVGRVHSSPVRVRRTARQLADGNDDLVIRINTHPNDAWVSTVRDDQWRSRPGEACLVRRDQPGAIESPSETRGLLNIAFSRRTLTPLLAGPTDLDQRPLRGEPVRLLRDCALTALQHGTDGTAIARQLHDLAALALGSSPHADRPALTRSLNAARLRALKADLAANATRGDLSLTRLARRHGISPGYVRALFERDGDTFTDYLLEQRLQRVRRVLSNPRYRHRPITTVALESGFNSPSWFYRAFKRRFGTTPSEYRAIGQAH